jgi:hypothetical protein
VHWSPRLSETAALAAVGLALAGAVVLVDPVGWVLVAAAAAGALALAGRDLLLRPRLSTGPAGVRVRRLSGTTTIAWPDLRVQVRVTRRLGIRSQTLELEDAGDEGILVVLGRHDLGAEPRPVAEALASRAARDTPTG